MKESFGSKSIYTESQTSFIIDVAEAATQTDQPYQHHQPHQIVSAGNTPLNKKFYLIDHKKALSKRKKQDQSRIKKVNQGLHSKHSSKDLYSHVRSKVYDKVETPRTPSGGGQRYSRNNTSSS